MADDMHTLNNMGCDCTVEEGEWCIHALIHMYILPQPLQDLSPQDLSIEHFPRGQVIPELPSTFYPLTRRRPDGTASPTLDQLPADGHPIFNK